MSYPPNFLLLWMERRANMLDNILFSMGAKETSDIFRPVRCTEKDIENKQSVKGFLYFTTDTKKMYLGVEDGKYISTGGNSGIFYGNRQLTDDEKYGEEVFFSFTPEEIDGNSIPAIDDLILNIPDGGFYRVLGVSNQDIQTQRLVIAGGGGSGGSGSGPVNEGTLQINFVSPQRDSTITGVEYYIEFDIIAKDSAGDMILDEGIATWKINGGQQITQKVKNGRNRFKVDEYLDPSQDENKVVLVVNMNTGGSSNSIVSKTWYIKAIDLKLNWEWDYDPVNYIKTDTFTLKFIPYGNCDCTVHIVFDGNYAEGKTYFTKNIYATGQEVFSNPIPCLEYGAHICEMYLTAIINGETYETPKTTHELTFIKDGTSTIITVPYYKKVASQYDTLNIPFMVYNPDTENCKVGFYINDERIPGENSYNRQLQYWPYTLTGFGTIKLSIRSDDGEASKDIELTVSELNLGASEVNDYKFSLKANNFSTNDELRNWSQNGITLTFSDGTGEFESFDWQNGGLKADEKDEFGNPIKYIRVRQGTSMTINYPLFGSFDAGASGGKNFKFCFKATNCYDYEAPVLNCHDGNIGLKLDAQKATISIGGLADFSTQYYENSYIELETEIWPNQKDKSVKIPGDRFVMFWVDGIPAGVKAYSYADNPDAIFTNDGRSITIGSKLCDVNVYVAKLYERRLTENEHLDNFIVDAPNATQMVDRYRRNDILDTRGEISYEKLIAQNPTCHAYLYEVPHMTKSKDDKDNDEELKKCKYTELFGDNNTLSNPYYTADNTQIYVQGTSSAAYGVAAFNLRSKFRKGLIDKDGNTVDGWKVSDDAIPINLPCTKVNVASCENVNNVINQEWYNRFQPYHDAHRRKSGAKYRDTMEFNSGVLFIKDNNKNDNYNNDKDEPDRAAYLNANAFADTNGYVSNPYYKQYAIANMGNDKKNIEVFHDIMNPKACCVEVLDNQNEEHWMTVYNPDAFKEKIVGKNDDGTDKTEGPYYEFRYGVGDCEAEDLQGVTEATQEKNFLDFVQWMASCDPSPYDEVKHPNGYTGNLLDTPVYYNEPKVFEGFDPPGYEGTENPSGISLKGFEISNYMTTPDHPYTHDTKEYRIAKMLYECEDHLVMDSVMYHYLFILRHTMVDNVAKNTFWSTEDGIHWDLTKDYDNDTADGNDNSGYLSFTYGMEFGDKDSTDGNVFNAADSVWINFIHELKSAQEFMYKKLESKSEWSAENYLAECKKHQNAIPERCWIYDYFRKYIRPRRLGLDENTYLKRLEGGKKTHQREQYEKYQTIYMNSKFSAGEYDRGSSSATINLRLNSGDASDPSNVLPVSYYTNCYGSALIGGQYYKTGRLTRKVPHNFPVGQILASASDGTCYFYGPSIIQTFEGLAPVYPNEADFSNANKLLSLELGSDAEGYHNNQLSVVSISAATMLQNVQIQNCGPENGLDALDLRNLHQLQSLKINGSTFKGLTLASDSIIDTLYLNDLETLTLDGLNKLTKDNLLFDEEIYNTLKIVSIIDCPAFDDFTYNLAIKNNLTSYKFNGFNWKITNIDDLIIQDEKVKSIKALDNLIEKKVSSTANALIGTLTIDVECNANEYDIYKLYSKIYPNLIIQYSNKVTLTAAKELIFRKYKNSNEYHYRVLGSGNEFISDLISESGPTGVAMSTPYKESNISTVFTFTGYWIDENSENKYYNPTDFQGENIPDISAISFAAFKPNAAVTIFYPEYLETPRQYSVRFKDWEGNEIPQKKADGTDTNAWLVNYGEKYDGPIKNFYYRDSSNLADILRWGFQGWSKYIYGDNAVQNPEYFDIINTPITGDLVLHSHFVKEDCTKVASPMEYFEIKGNVINLNPIYKNTLKGKITVPTVENVTTIGDFSDTINLTHIYFLDNNNLYTKVSPGAFKLSNAPGSISDDPDYYDDLIVVMLPKSVIEIGSSAFEWRIQLEQVGISDNLESIGSNAFAGAIFRSTPKKLEFVGLDPSSGGLPKNLKSLGSMSFWKCQNEITVLPDGITSIPSSCFANNDNVNISDFGIGNSKLTEIGSQAFFDAGTYGKINLITIGKQVGFSGGSGAFDIYGHGPAGMPSYRVRFEATKAEIDSYGGDGKTGVYWIGFPEDICEFAES